MVVILTTTVFALGVGALAAFVVPWFRFKPGDNADDNRKATPIQDAVDSVSRSRSHSYEKSSSITGSRKIRLRGFNFVKVVISKACTSSNTSGASASNKSARVKPTMTEFYQENSSTVKTRIPIHESQCSNNFALGTLGGLNGRWKCRFFNNFETTEPQRKDTRLGIINSGCLNRRFVNSERFDYRPVNLGYFVPKLINLRSSTSQLNPIIEEHRSLDQSSFDPSDLTSIGASAGETTNTPSTVSTAGSSSNTDDDFSAETRTSREADNGFESGEKSAKISMTTEPSESWVNTDRSFTETTNRNSTFRVFSDETVSLPRQNPVRSDVSVESSEVSGITNKSTTLTSRDVEASREVSVESSEVSGITNKSTTLTSREASTSREIETSTANSDKLAVNESSEMTEFLETINEISEITNKTSQDVSSDQESSEREIKMDNSYVSANLSIKSYQAGNTNDKMSRTDAIEPEHFSFDENLNFAKCSTYENHEKEETKLVKRSRYSQALSDRIKRFWRDITVYRSVDKSHIESVTSLSMRNEIPAGHSTLMNVESTGSRSISRKIFLQRYEDPRIEKIFYSSIHETERSSMDLDEEPLDLSIQRETNCHEENKNSLEFHEENTNSLDFYEKNENSLDIREKKRIIPNHHRDKCEALSFSRRKSHEQEARGFKRQVFRDVVDPSRVKRVASTSEGGATRSDSIKFYRDPSDSFLTDENENIVSLNSNASVTMRWEKKFRFMRNKKEIERGLDGDESKNTKKRGFSEKLKKIFDFRRKKGDEQVSGSGKNEKNAEIVSGEFQRVSLEAISKTKRNVASKDCSSKSELSNVSSYLEMGFIVSDDEDYIGPCTEL